jgi:hypothetical protein
LANIANQKRADARTQRDGPRVGHLDRIEHLDRAVLRHAGIVRARADQVLADDQARIEVLEADGIALPLGLLDGAGLVVAGDGPVIDRVEMRLVRRHALVGLGGVETAGLHRLQGRLLSPHRPAREGQNGQAQKSGGLQAHHFADRPAYQVAP